MKILLGSRFYFDMFVSYLFSYKIKTDKHEEVEEDGKY